MYRGRRTPDGQVRRNREEALQAVKGSLRTLNLLATGYDCGHFDCARDLCVVIERVLQEEARIAGIRGALRLPSFAHPESNQNLLPQWRLIGFEMSAADVEREIERIQFVPVCAREGHTVNWLPFARWWSEAVYIEGSGGPSSQVPLIEEDRIPFKRRRMIKRMDFIQRTRREIGAHYDENKGETWNYFSRWNNEISFSTPTYASGNEWNSHRHPDHFEYMNTISDAAIRCIAEEVALGLKRFLS